MANGVTLNIRDVNPETKKRLKKAAKDAGLSLAAYVREKLDEIAGTPKRELGLLGKKWGPVGDPIDGWDISPEELEAWEGKYGTDFY